MTKKTLLIILSIGLIVSLSGAAVSSVLADEDNYNHPMIQRLAEAFGVEEDEVEAVFDAVKEERHEEMQQRHQEGLNQAVENGVLTQEQMNALQEKHQEMWQERSQEKQQHREEMDTWFEDQGIDHDALIEYMGGSGPKGGIGMKRQGMRHSE